MCLDMFDPGVRPILSVLDACPEPAPPPRMCSKLLMTPYSLSVPKRGAPFVSDACYKWAFPSSALTITMAVAAELATLRATDQKIEFARLQADGTQQFQWLDG